MKKLMFSLLLIGSVSMAEITSDMQAQAATANEEAQVVETAVSTETGPDTDALREEVKCLQSKYTLWSMARAASYCKWIAGYAAFLCVAYKLPSDEGLAAGVIAYALHHLGKIASLETAKAKDAYDNKINEAKEKGIHFISL